MAQDKFVVLVPLWIDGFGPFVQGDEQGFDDVDPALVAHMVAAGQIAPLGAYQPPVEDAPAPVEAIEMHPNHVGTGKPAADTWEAIWSKPAKTGGKE